MEIFKKQPGVLVYRHSSGEFNRYSSYNLLAGVYKSQRRIRVKAIRIKTVGE